MSTNKAAVRLWESLGFKIIGTVPAAFRLPDASYADLHVMYLAAVSGPMRHRRAPALPGQGDGRGVTRLRRPSTPAASTGDRWFAVWDDDGRMATGKDSRRFRRRDEIFEFRATTTEDGVRIDGPRWLLAASATPRSTTRSATTWGAGAGARRGRGLPLRRRRPSRSSAPHRWSWCREHLEVDGDVRRLRTNLVVATTEPFVEETWTDGVVRVGEVELDVVERTERCRMVDIAQDGLPPQPGWLKSSAASASSAWASTPSVRTPGRIGRGDPSPS